MIEKLKKIDESPLIEILYVAILVMIGAFIRLYSIDYESIKLDEAQSIWQAMHTTEYINEYMSKNVHLPLHNTLLHYWLRYFGTSESSVRIMAAIPGILTLPALYFLAKEIVSKNTARIALFIGVISPFWIWYSREIRMYTLLALVTTLSYLFFIRILKYNKTFSYIAFTVVNIIGIYTHYFFIFALLSQAVFFFLSWKESFTKDRRIKKQKQLVNFVLIILILEIALVPWILRLMNSTGIGKFGPSLAEPNAFNIALSLFEFTYGYQPIWITSLFMALWPLAILFVFLFLTKRSSPFSSFVYLLFIGIFLPIMIVYFASITYKPMYLTRYLFPVTPLYIIMVSWFIDTIKGKHRTILWFLFIPFLLFTLINQTVNTNNPAKENYRGVIEYVNENSSYRDVVVVSPPYTIYPFQYYYEGNADYTTMPIWDKRKGEIPQPTEDRLISDGNTIKEGHKYIYLILTDNLDMNEEVKDYFDMNFNKIEKQQFSEHLWLHVYNADFKAEMAEN